MNLHEYQAKDLLKRYHVPVQSGILCVNTEEVIAAYKEVSTNTKSRFVVAKAQIHAGGRGKGTFIEVPEQHGVHALLILECLHVRVPSVQDEDSQDVLCGRR